MRVQWGGEPFTVVAGWLMSGAAGLQGWLRGGRFSCWHCWTLKKARMSAQPELKCGCAWPPHCSWDFNGGDISATVRAAPAPATNGSTAQLRESNGSAASVGAGESAADEAAAAAAEAVGEAAEVLTGQFDTVRAAPAAVAAAAVLGAAAGATVVAAGVAAAAAAATGVEEEEQGSAQAASSSALRHPSAPAVPDRPAVASRGTLPAADAVQEQRPAAQDTGESSFTIDSAFFLLDCNRGTSIGCMHLQSKRTMIPPPR